MNILIPPTALEAMRDTSMGLKRQPTQQRSLERIESILDAAAGEITETGYSDLSVLKIAARAGITPTSIYHYFSSLEAILITLMRRSTEDFGNQLIERIRTLSSAQELIECFVEGLQLGWHEFHSNRIFSGLWAASHQMVGLRRVDDELKTGLFKAFSQRARELVTSADHAATESALFLGLYLSTPLFERLLLIPVEQQQEHLLNTYIELHKTRLADLLQPR